MAQTTANSAVAAYLAQFVVDEELDVLMSFTSCSDAGDLLGAKVHNSKIAHAEVRALALFRR